MKYQPTRHESERSYPVPVAEAWRLLADTDHLNRAIGLPSVEFSALPDPLVRRAGQGARRLTGGGSSTPPFGIIQ